MAGTLKTLLTKSLERAELSILRSFVDENPSATLSELLALDPRFGNLTVADIKGGAVTGPRGRKGGGKGRGQGRDPSSVPSASTRTAADRRDYDDAMLAALRASDADADASMTELRAVVGGERLQARKSLARLVKARKVKRTGRAKGTRYKAR